MSFDTPILLCTFNRPDLTERVFRRIASVLPRRLLISSDGPRETVPGDSEQVNRTREIATRINWRCDVRTYFADTNRGCRRQMSDAISWAFDQFDQLIILEDDCLPDRTFFWFCEKLLARYATDPRVMMISGDNFQAKSSSPFSYYFSKYSHIWGWASWRRAWQHFDLEMKSWPEARTGGLVERWAIDSEERRFWIDLFDRQHALQIDTWDFSWAYACWRYGGWTILPNINLVQNIGFDPRATHTTDEKSPLANRPAQRMSRLIHPNVIARDTEADHYSWRHVFQPNRGSRWDGNWLSRLSKLRRAA